MEELDEILVEAIGHIIEEEELAKIMKNYFLVQDNNDRRQYIIDNISEYANHQRNLCAHRFEEIKGLIKKPVKLVIVGEAPINSVKYFYNAPRSYLTCIKHYLAWDNVGIEQPNPQAKYEHLHYDGNQILQFKNHLANNVNLYNTLADFGILVWDLYKWPLPPIIYQNNHQQLLDNEYILNQINQLTEENLIDENTQFVFRYQNLIDRGLVNNHCFNGRNFIMNNGVPVRLAIRDIGYTVLSQEVINFFEGHNFRTEFQNQFVQ